MNKDKCDILRTQLNKYLSSRIFNGVSDGVSDIINKTFSPDEKIEDIEKILKSCFDILVIFENNTRQQYIDKIIKKYNLYDNELFELVAKFPNENVLNLFIDNKYVFDINKIILLMSHYCKGKNDAYYICRKFSFSEYVLENIIDNHSDISDEQKKICHNIVNIHNSNTNYDFINSQIDLGNQINKNILTGNIYVKDVRVAIKNNSLTCDNILFALIMKVRKPLIMEMINNIPKIDITLLYVIIKKKYISDSDDFSFTENTIKKLLL